MGPQVVWRAALSARHLDCSARLTYSPFGCSRLPEAGGVDLDQHSVRGDDCTALTHA
jgi:hypothetical protein